MSAKPRTLPTASLSLHPQAGLVPEMAPDQYRRFLADIRARGVLQPIELIPGTRTVIEGRTRLRAATEAGLISVPVVDADIPDSPVLYMLRGALLRRHLSPSQAAALAVEVEAELARVAKERQREGGRKGGQTAGRGRARSSAEPAPTGGPKPGQARDQAAAIAGTNPRYVSEAKRIKETAPAVFEKVKAGELNIPAAKRQIQEKAKPPLDPEPVVVCKVKGGPVKLLPCPFCGSTEIVLEVVTHWVARKKFAKHARCEKCGATGPNQEAERELVRAAWNRRTGC